MRAWVSLVLVAIGCSPTSTSDPGDAGSDAADEAEAQTACISDRACRVVADCAPDGGVTGCWTCLAGCCIPVPGTTDPKKVCDAGRACMTSTCDGVGTCTRSVQAKEGTACGATCGGVFVFAT